MVDITLTEQQQQLAESLFTSAEAGVAAMTDPAQKKAAEDAIASIRVILSNNRITDAEVGQLKAAAKKIPGAESLNGWIENPTDTEEQKKLKAANLNPADPMQGLMMMIFSFIAQVLGLDPAALGLNQDTAPAVEAAAAQTLAADLPAADPAAPATPAFNATTAVAELGIGKLPSEYPKAIEGGTIVPQTDEEKAIEIHTAKKNAERLGEQEKNRGWFGNSNENQYYITDSLNNAIPILDYYGLPDDIAKENLRAGAYSLPNFSATLDAKLSSLDATIKADATKQVEAEIRSAAAASKLPEGFDKDTLDKKNDDIENELRANQSALQGLRTSEGLTKEQLLENIGDYRSAQELAAKPANDGNYGQSNWDNFDYLNANATEDYIKQSATNIINKNAEAEAKARVELAKIMKEEQELVAKRLELIKEQAVLAEKQARAPKIQEKYTEIETAAAADKERDERARISKEAAAQTVEVKAAEVKAASGASAPTATEMSEEQKLNRELGEKNALRVQYENRVKDIIEELKGPNVVNGVRINKAELRRELADLHETKGDLRQEIAAIEGKLERIEHEREQDPLNKAKKAADNLIIPLGELYKKQEELVERLERIDARSSITGNSTTKYRQSVQAELDAVNSRITTLEQKISPVEEKLTGLENIEKMKAEIVKKQAEVERLGKQIDGIEGTKTKLAYALKVIDEVGTKIDGITKDGASGIDDFAKGPADEDELLKISKKLSGVMLQAREAGAHSIADNLGKGHDVIVDALQNGGVITVDEMKNIKKVLRENGIVPQALDTMIDGDAEKLRADKTKLEDEILELQGKVGVKVKPADDLSNNRGLNNTTTSKGLNA